MSEYKKRIFVSGVLAVILVALLAGASYYLIPPETTPTLSPKPIPTPIPKPPLLSTPTLIPIPMPTVPPGPRIVVNVEVVSIEGFDYTVMGYGHPEKVLVLHQGGSGKIKLAIELQGNESRKASLSFYVIGKISKDMEGVKCRFEPLTLDLQPEEKAESILILEAASDAANGLYFPVISVYVKGLGEYEQSLDLPILVFPRTPDYIFIVYPTPPTSPTPETTVTPPPTPLPYPTPHPTPLPTLPPPKPYVPEIEIKKGGEVYLIFYIEHPAVKSHTLNLTYRSGTLPKGISVELTDNPLKVVPSPRIESILVTLKVGPEVGEGSYRIVAKGSVDGAVYERVFNLKVVE